ncbi:MAG: hypothetical protein WC758_05805 [Candidatus Woesearchaeota archaeon]|jgi:hypothetical protein
MVATNVSQVMSNSQTIFFKLQGIHKNYLEQVVDLYKEQHEDLKKYMNRDAHINQVGLKEVVDTFIDICNSAKEEIHFAKAKLYYMDGEKYRLMDDQRSYNYFKKRCKEEFKKITDPEIIQKFKVEFGDYLPKK